MWRKFLRILIESCVYMDPLAYMFYAAAKRESARRVWTSQDETDEQELLRLIERLESRREARA